MNLSLRQLAAFEAVARAGSFTAAAERLCLSQSALSRTVAGVERTLRVSLFERTTRTVTLTAEGRQLLAVADRILAAHRTGMNDLARYLAGEHGTVTIATLPSVAAVLLPRVLSAFHEQHPGITVRILDGLAGTVTGHLLDGDADLAITIPDGAPPRMRRRALALDRFFAALPPGHRLAERATLTWSDLAPQPFVAIGADSSVRMFTDAAFATAGVSAAQVVEAANVATVGGLVAAGLGVSALPALVQALMSFAGLVHRPLTGPVVERRLDVILPDRGAPAPAARHFLDLLATLHADAFPMPAGVRWAAPTVPGSGFQSAGQ
ncbi:LysR family transcriptional regulator [Actinoallomurus acanthiterrae]